MLNTTLFLLCSWPALTRPLRSPRGAAALPFSVRAIWMRRSPARAPTSLGPGSVIPSPATAPGSETGLGPKPDQPQAVRVHLATLSEHRRGSTCPPAGCRVGAGRTKDPPSEDTWGPLGPALEGLIGHDSPNAVQPAELGGAAAGVERAWLRARLTPRQAEPTGETKGCASLGHFSYVSQ